MAIVAATTFGLDLRYSFRIEKGDDPILRLNKEEFNTNPIKELRRYIQDITYYNNRWRVSMLSTALICFVIYPIIKPEFRKHSIYVFFIVFVIIYHTHHWKTHHSIDFMHKTVIDACSHLLTNKNKSYEPLTHI